MNASHILKLMNGNPFEPFEIRMSDGGRVMVEHPWQIATSPHSAVCAIFEDPEGMHIVAIRNITEIVTATPV